MSNEETKLSIERQEEFIRQCLGNPKFGQQMINQAIMQGVIDPSNVRWYRRAVEKFTTRDSDTQRIKERAMMLSKISKPVLILGESGTGKELIAEILHGERNGFFVPVNVCAVTETLFESELFGHVRGSFTGADKDRDGLIQHAEGGTLFLDEIGDMPLQTQAKLLRVINNKKYRKVGSNVDIELGCRIVAATHRDLKAMIRDNLFRLDLKERLEVFRLKLKPLRDRLDDIPLYVGQEFADYLKPLIATNTHQLFSGNIRQLLNLKERYDAFGNGEITVDDID
jgi:DNA-binding NtrC family response regulator